MNALTFRNPSVSSGPYLLFDTESRQLFPLSEHALSHSQLSLRRLQMSSGSILVSRNGVARRVRSIRSLGFRGGSVAATIANVLTRFRTIDMDLVAIDLSFSDFVDLVRTGMTFDLDLFFEGSKAVDQASRELDECADFDQVFRFLGVMTDEDCMDVF
jgi:hypothetical protein